MSPSPYLQDSDFTLYCGDGRLLIRDVIADAIVTSPPYADARPEVPAPGPDEFAEWLSPFLIELLEAIPPSGSMMLNLGRRFSGGEESGYVFDVLAEAKRLGWKHIDTLIWHKPNANGRGGPYLHDKHEYVWWLAPADAEPYRGYDADTRVPYADGTAARYERGCQNAAKYHPRELRSRECNPLGAKPSSVVSVYTGGEKAIAHPSPMPRELARKLVALCCPPGGTVLDPFCGSGTTALAARKLGRKCIGIELEPTFCAEAARRTSQLSLESEVA